jgi:hypothetical protein
MKGNLRAPLRLLAACRDAAQQLAVRLEPGEVRAFLGETADRCSQALSGLAGSLPFSVAKMSQWDSGTQAVRAYVLQQRIYGLQVCFTFFENVLVAKFLHDWNSEPSAMLTTVLSLEEFAGRMEALTNSLRTVGFSVSAPKSDDLELVRSAGYMIPLSLMPEAAIQTKFGAGVTRDRVEKAVTSERQARRWRDAIDGSLDEMRSALLMLGSAALRPGAFPVTQLNSEEERLAGREQRLQLFSQAATILDNAAAQLCPVMQSIFVDWDCPGAESHILDNIGSGMPCGPNDAPSLPLPGKIQKEELGDTAVGVYEHQQKPFRIAPIGRIQAVEAVELGVICELSRIASVAADSDEMPRLDRASERLLAFHKATVEELGYMFLLHSQTYHEGTTVLDSEHGAMLLGGQAVNMACRAAEVVARGQGCVHFWLLLITAPGLSSAGSETQIEVANLLLEIFTAAHQPIAKLGAELGWAELTEAQQARVAGIDRGDYHYQERARRQLSSELMALNTLAMSSELLTARCLILHDAVKDGNENAANASFAEADALRLQIQQASKVLAVAYDALSQLNVKLVTILQERGFPELASEVAAIF